jgi:hypothetical protein
MAAEVTVMEGMVDFRRVDRGKSFATCESQRWKQSIANQRGPRLQDGAGTDSEFKGVFGSLRQLRKSHLIPPFSIFWCLVAWLG